MAILTRSDTLLPDPTNDERVIVQLVGTLTKLGRNLVPFVSAYDDGDSGLFTVFIDHPDRTSPEGVTRGVAAIPGVARVVTVDTGLSATTEVGASMPDPEATLRAFREDPAAPVTLAAACTRITRDGWTQLVVPYHYVDGGGIECDRPWVAIDRDAPANVVEARRGFHRQDDITMTGILAFGSAPVVNAAALMVAIDTFVECGCSVAVHADASHFGAPS